MDCVVQLRADLRTGESASIEFKTSLSDTRKIVETIAAMATIGGGRIYVGVRDTGEVCGVQLGKGAIEQFVQRVLTATDPRVYIDAETLDVDGCSVLSVVVPPGDGPNLAYGRAFYRSGPSTVANAVAHRDYRSTAPTQLVLTETGLRIWNPGHLPRPLTVEDLYRTHPSIPPNPGLPAVFEPAADGADGAAAAGPTRATSWDVVSKRGLCPSEWRVQAHRCQRPRRAGADGSRTSERDRTRDTLEVGIDR